MIAVCWNFAVSLGKDRCVFSSLPLRVATARAICPALFWKPIGLKLLDRRVDQGQAGAAGLIESE
jgi:hypothetical protein